MRRATWGLGLAFLLVGLTAQGQFAPGPALDPTTPCVAVRVRVPADAAPGAELTYRITAENTTRAAAHHVLVKIALPKNAKLVRTTPAAESEGSNVRWKIGTLGGGARREFSLVLIPEGDADLDLCARVQYEHGQCVKTRIVRPGLQFRRAGPTTAARNDIVTYKLEVSNTGKGTAQEVVVEETLPKGLEFLDGKPATKGDNPLVWRLGDIPSGGTRRIEYQALVARTGDLTIQGEAKSGTLRREASTTLKVGEPTLEVAMAGPARAAKRMAVTYRIVVTNPGSLPLTDVRLLNDLPEGITFVGATGGGKLDARAIRWTLGKIPAGGKVEVTLDVQATEAGEFKNVCTATADRGLREQAKAVTVFTD